MLIGSAMDGRTSEVNHALRATENAVQSSASKAELAVSSAYHVDLKGPEETFQSHWLELDSKAYLLTRSGQSKESELAELQASVEVLEATRAKSLGGIQSANARLDNLPDDFETVTLTPSALQPSPETQRLMDIIRWASEQFNKSMPKIEIDGPPGGIGTIKSRHYTWTYKGGIVENAAEADRAEEALKNTMKQDLSDTISNILKPYETYSEAADILHDKDMAATIYEQGGDDILRYTKELSGGLFGKLAAQLNNYAKVFGADDDFLKDIRAAFDSLTPAGGEMNPLVRQMDEMVDYVQGGGELDVKDPKFLEKVKQAVAEAYKKKKEAENVKPQALKAEEEIPKPGFTYLDQLRQNLEETSDLLDKMMPENKKEEHRTKSAGDVLAARAPKDNFDPEEHKKLAHVGEEKAPAYQDSGIFDKKKSVDALSADTEEVLSALQSGWKDYIREHSLIDEGNLVNF